MNSSVLILALVLAITQLLDWYTTRTILNKGGYEQNPVMAKMFALLGVDAALVVKGILVVALGWFIGQQSIIVLQCLIILYVTVIIHNWKSM